MYKCKYCNKEFSSAQSLAGHIGHCKMNPNFNYDKYVERQKTGAIKGNKKRIEKYLKLNENDLSTLKLRELTCSKCGSIYYLELTDKQFNKGLYKKTCSSKCAHSRTHSEETKNKIKESLQQTIKSGNFIAKNQYSSIDYKSTYISELIQQGKILNENNYPVNDKLLNENSLKEKTCIICGRKYYGIINSSGNISTGQTCSEKCHKQLKSIRSKESIERIKNEGRFVGWKTRNIKSYAEKFWHNVLQNNNIEYVSEHFLDKKYFLDFYIIKNGIKIDLEIDGKQHKYEDRIGHDKIRDEYIKSKNIIVYRIEWNEINSENGSNLMKEKINKFLEFYNKL